MSEYMSREKAQEALAEMDGRDYQNYAYYIAPSRERWLYHTIDQLYSEIDRLREENAKLRERLDLARRMFASDWEDDDDDWDTPLQYVDGVTRTGKPDKESDG